jgi:peptidoglycan/xylan/chitin deacetylase (PgdA/CDA1 family)
VSALVLCYHAVSGEWPSSLAVAPERLREQLSRLLARGYEGATFGQVARGEAPRRALAVTFDDGYRSNLTLGLPVLRQLGLPATVFVPTAHVGTERPMSWPGIEEWSGTEHEQELIPLSWQELRELQGHGWEVGSHTVTHPHLPALDDAALARELASSKQECERELGTPCRTLAYPYGDHDDRVAAAAAEAGYEAAAILAMGPQSQFRWPRVGIYPPDERRARFAIKTSAAVRALRSSSAGRLLERLRGG